MSHKGNLTGRLKADDCRHGQAAPATNARSLPRRGFLLSCGCAALTVSAAGAGIIASATRAEAQAGGQLIKVGHLPAGCVAHLLLAKKRGMFQAAGLNAELTQFNGPATNLQALIAGSVNVMHNPWTTTMAAYGQGASDLRIIGGSGISGIELVARKGSVKNVNEFIAAAGSGLKVGTLKLDTLELVTYGTMAQAGKSYADYDMTFFPSMVGMGEALQNGAVDVCSLAQPYAEGVVLNTDGVYIANSNDVWGPEAPDCVITTKSETLAANSALLTAYMAVLKDAAVAFYSDFDSALDDLQPIYGVPRHILAIALKRQSPNPVIEAAGSSGIKGAMKYLIALGYFKDNFADKVLNLSIQPEAA